MKLKKNQVKLFNLLVGFIKNNEKMFLVQGEAGSGKTFSISYLLNKLLKKGYFEDYNLFVIAPTNAAKKVIRKTIMEILKNDKEGYKKFEKHLEEDKNISFNTIHSFFKSKKTYDEEGNQYFKILWSKSVLTEMIKEQNKIKKVNPDYKVKQKNLIILDETSMLDPDKFNCFERLLQKYSSSKIIFMGDKNQLSYITKFKNDKNYLSPIFNLDNTFLLIGNERSNHKNITKIINKSKKCVINNKYNFVLTKKDLSENVKLFIETDLKNINQEETELIKFIRNNKCKIITYSNKRKDTLNNIIREIIYTKDNPYINDYLFLEKEQLIFENTYMLGPIVYHNTDEVKIKKVKYQIVKKIIFFDLFRKNFIIQEILLEDEVTLYQICKEQLKVFEDIIKILKKCVKDYFYYDKKFTKLLNKNCEFCNEEKCEFKTFYDEEKICKECYLKFYNYIKTRFFCANCNEFRNHDDCDVYYRRINIGQIKKKIFNELYLDINDLNDKYNLPVSYSYSITCYKSQGNTYENVIIDYSNLYECNKNNIKNLTRAMYVSISRCKNKLYFLNYFYD